jgi:hypothetical protein
MGAALTPAVTKRLQLLEYDGFCSMQDMSKECYDGMGKLSESEALSAIDELQPYCLFNFSTKLSIMFYRRQGLLIAL